LVHLFAGDAVFAVLIYRPNRHNGFGHDPEEAAATGSVFAGLAETVPLLAATHLLFPSIGRVAVDSDAFRFLPVFWEYGPLLA
jgi:hypothetical protein